MSGAACTAASASRSSAWSLVAFSAMRLLKKLLADSMLDVSTLWEMSAKNF
ncbi:hypothetical protein ACQW02_17130 [Humitalea sp. 24SJ18S-53]|uniref:hypothetical protein n=1 Tax=Humitalea sp. 24SJ18S-53 TaxID=3422307 RepID=UPI003D67CD5C